MPPYYKTREIFVCDLVTETRSDCWGIGEKNCNLVTETRNNVYSFVEPCMPSGHGAAKQHVQLHSGQALTTIGPTEKCCHLAHQAREQNAWYDIVEASNRPIYRKACPKQRTASLQN